MHREYPFNTDTERHLPHHKGFPDTAAFAGNNHPLKRLQPLLVTFYNLDIYPDSISNIKCRDLPPEAFLNRTYLIHLLSPCLWPHIYLSKARLISQYLHWSKKPFRADQVVSAKFVL